MDDTVLSSSSDDDDSLLCDMSIGFSPHPRSTAQVAANVSQSTQESDDARSPVAQNDNAVSAIEVATDAKPPPSSLNESASTCPASPQLDDERRRKGQSIRFLVNLWKVLLFHGAVTDHSLSRASHLRSLSNRNILQPIRNPSHG